MDAELLVNPGSKYRGLSLPVVPQYHAGQEVKVHGWWRKVWKQIRTHVYVDTPTGTVAYHVAAIQGVR